MKRKRIHILTTPDFKSDLYFFPLRVHSKKLLDSGLSFHFFSKLKPSFYEADQMLLDQKYFRTSWKGTREEMIGLLQKLKKKVDQLLWFDSTASTHILEPGVLPYVDFYYKGLILKNKNSYLSPFYSNRIFADYYHKNLGIKDIQPVEPLYVKNKEDLRKIKLLWNYSLGGGFGLKGKYSNLLQKFLPFRRAYGMNFIPPYKHRPVDLSCRISTNYGRKSISYQRKKTAALLKERFDLETKPIPLKKYYKELKKAKIALSPFGWGEINYRDFEIISAGAALMKPSMEHTETWPDFYIKDKTYISYSWDFHDLEENFNLFLQKGKYEQIAGNAQSLFKKYVSKREGREEFLQRVINIFLPNK